MAFTACKENDIMLFDLEETGVYFQGYWNSNNAVGGMWRYNTSSYYTTSRFSFSRVPIEVTDTMLFATVRTMGKVKNYPRTVKILVDQDSTTAVNGVHYSIDLSSVVIPPGESETHVRVRFNRTTNLRRDTVRLELKLEESEHFKIFMTEQKGSSVYSSTGGTISADRFRFYVSDIYSQPMGWRSGEWGAWSPEKQLFVQEVLGWEPERFDVALSGSAAVIALRLRAELQRLADAGTPMREINGDFMQLGNAYLVDYSAYD